MKRGRREGSFSVTGAQIRRLIPNEYCLIDVPDKKSASALRSLVCQIGRKTGFLFRTSIDMINGIATVLRLS